MKRILKSFICCVSVLFSLSLCFAQVSVDPQHSFYKDAQNWNVKGVVKQLPPLRPYSLQAINNILQTVIQEGSEADSEKAQAYWEEINGRAFHIQVETDANLKNTDFEAAAFPEIHGDINLLDGIASAGYKIGVSEYTTAALDYKNGLLPFGSNLYHDTVQDPARIGPLYSYFDANENIAVGTGNCYAQLGINRLGYGKFLNQGVTLNDSAYHSANISFNYISDFWTFTQLYSSIGASKAYDGTKLKNNKYLTFHQIEVFPTDNISFSYYENIVYGNRFDFSYLIPAPYMAIQGLGGCEDNLQMGVTFNYRPMKGLLWATDVFVDDLSVNELVKFDFDTKIRIAAITGLIYVPEMPVLDRVEFNYTAVTPYTYTHWDFDDVTENNITANCYSYQNYTNNGIPIGSALPPNSQQIHLGVDMTPVSKLNLNFTLNYIMHGNSAENIDDLEALGYLMAEPKVYATDGSIYHHVYNLTYKEKINGSRGYLPSAWEKLNWLNQNHLMHIFQFGLDASYRVLNSKWGSLDLYCSYMGEYTHNKGVDSNIFPGVKAVKNNDGTYTAEGVNYTSVSELVNNYKAAWASNLHNVFNNYVYVGLRYRW